MKHLKLDRPLICFDLETTGTDPGRDRIVEIAALRIETDGSRDSRCRRVNPERPIPPGATAVHGIRDEDVRDQPTFKKISKSLHEWLAGADLAGFNVLRFDIPLLDREFRDCELDLDVAGRRVIDTMTIFHRKEPRDLTAAVRYYLGRDHEGAHAADADVEATFAVLEAQLERYDDLPRDVEQLHRWVLSGRGDAVDRTGKFVWKEGELLFAFGKFQGRTLRSVVDESPGYLKWILGSNFPDDAKQLVEGALRGEYPARA